MKSWKTTLGGSAAALGTFLWGAPMALKAMDFPVEQSLVKWCIISGLIANAAGVLCMGLFGRDNNVTSEQVQAAKEKKDEPPPFRADIWIIAGLLALSLAGCITLNKAVVTTTSVVDRAMISWAQASVEGRTTPALDARVIAAHDHYRVMCGRAVLAYEAAQSMGDEPSAASVLVTLRASVDPLMELIFPVISAREAEQLKTQLGKANAP